MSLVCQFGGQGTTLQNMTCPLGAEYCGTVQKDGENKVVSYHASYMRSNIKYIMNLPGKSYHKMYNKVVE